MGCILPTRNPLVTPMWLANLPSKAAISGGARTRAYVVVRAEVTAPAHLQLLWRGVGDCAGPSSLSFKTTLPNSHTQEKLHANGEGVANFTHHIRFIYNKD